MFRTYQTFAPSIIARGAGRLIGVASLASFVGLQEVRLHREQGRGGRTDPRAVSRVARHGVTVTRSRRRLPDGPEPRDPQRRARQDSSADTRWAASARRELAGAAIYLASEAASFVTAS